MQPFSVKIGSHSMVNLLLSAHTAIPLHVFTSRLQSALLGLSENVTGDEALDLTTPPRAQSCRPIISLWCLPISLNTALFVCNHGK